MKIHLYDSINKILLKTANFQLCQLLQANE